MPKRTADRPSVGRGMPPVETRFKKGQSGNPRGRPPKQTCIRSIIRDELLAPIQVVIDGRRRKVPFIQGYAMQVRQKVLQGDSKAQDNLQKLMRFMLAGQPAGDDQPRVTAAELTAEDEKLLRAILGKPGEDSHDQT